MKKQTYASVWDALEESPEAATTMRLRADLMIAVQRHVAPSGLTQAPPPRNSASPSRASTICSAAASTNPAWTPW